VFKIHLSLTPLNLQNWLKLKHVHLYFVSVKEADIYKPTNICFSYANYLQLIVNTYQCKIHDISYDTAYISIDVHHKLSYIVV